MIDLVRKIECVVRLKEGGKSPALLDYLAGRFTYRDREGWREKIAAGEILLDGRAAAPETVLLGGEKIAYFPGDLPEPEVNRNYRIVYRDDRIVVADKPGNLPTHPAGRYFKNTLWYLLRRDFDRELYPVNRLDSETSGLILWACDPEGAGFLAGAGRTGNKIYAGVAEGDFPEKLRASGFLFPDRESRVRKKRKFSFSPPERGVRSENCDTSFEKIASGNGRSLIRAELHTGRTHQIRATLRSLGYPLCGDVLYGRDEGLFLERAGGGAKAGPFPELALKAVHLELIHPGSRKKLVFDLPVPGSFTALLGGNFIRGGS